ncbi:MAG: hypothetical protein AB7I50_11515 [Vicinamibacterales bacterium]
MEAPEAKSSEQTPDDIPLWHLFVIIFLVLILLGFVLFALVVVPIRPVGVAGG